MNKTEFIMELKKELNYSEDKCTIINNILESNFFINKKNRNKIIKKLEIELNVDNYEATDIYDIAVRIINNEIKGKLKHPFKSID